MLGAILAAAVALAASVTIEQDTPHSLRVYLDGEYFAGFACSLELHQPSVNQDLTAVVARGWRQPDPAYPHLYAGHAAVAWHRRGPPTAGWDFKDVRLAAAPDVVRASGDVLVWRMADWGAFDLAGWERLLPGDANGDGRVSVGDLSVLGAHWGRAATWRQGDFDGDWQVSIGDVSVLASRWGSSARLPEPAAGALLAAAAGLGLLRRRRQKPRPGPKGR